VTESLNAVNKTKAMRSVMESTLGVDKNAWIPEYAKKTFPQIAEKSADWPVRDGSKTQGKVAIFSTCYVNYNEPGIGQDLIAILNHNEVPYVLVEKRSLLWHAQARVRRLGVCGCQQRKEHTQVGQISQRRLYDCDAHSILHIDV